MLGYFDLSRAQREREVANPSAGGDMRLWAYAHVPLYLGLAALAAGTVHAAGQEVLSRSAQWIFVSGITSVMLGLTLIGVASSASLGQRLRGAAPHLVIAGLFVGAAGGLDIQSPATLFLAGTGIFALQLAVARRRRAV